MQLIRDTLIGRTWRAWRYRQEEKHRQPGELRPLSEHISAVVSWLLRAQRSTPDDGVAASYDVRACRWQASYPETTGYIICSLLRAADAGFVKEAKLIDAAVRMGLWLTTKQLSNGAFPGGTVAVSDPAPAVFNTGQIVKGLTDLVHRGLDPTGEMENAAKKAVHWLIDIQDEDGCWRKGISKLTSSPIHSYNVRTAWALARYGMRLNYPNAIEAATKNGRWVCTIQKSDGWFDYMNFHAGESPLTHTIAYTIQGLMELGVIVNDDEFVERARVAAEAVYHRQNADTGALPGQFKNAWRPVGGWTSITGNAQMSIIGHRLSTLTGDETWRTKAQRATCLCRMLQEFDHVDAGRSGAVRGSYPGHLGYGQYRYMNWAQKFYLDALLCDVGVEIV